MLIYVSVDATNKVRSWGSTSGSDSDIEVDIPDDHIFLTDIPFYYTLVNGELIKDNDMILQKARESKKAELNMACNRAITGRFSADVNGVTYLFSNDTEAQSNFKDARASFEDGTVDMYMNGEIPWTAYDMDGNVVRLQLTKELFTPVNIARMFHQQNNVSKFRDDLEKKVDLATSVPEVNAITWE